MPKSCVLVVEDQNDFLTLLKLVLEGEGYYVSAAEDGEKAIELLKEFRPAAIVTDLMMPEVTGIDLIEHVRKTPELERIPIIAVSAGDREMLEEAKKAGATETLKKPVDFEELLKRLNRYVPPNKPISQ